MRAKRAIVPIPPFIPQSSIVGARLGPVNCARAHASGPLVHGLRRGAVCAPGNDGRRGVMQFGIFDQIDRGLYPLAEQYEKRLELIAFYDACGFRTYHMSEHHATPLNLASSPSVFLAAVAQRTRRIRFGALVYVLPAHHPLRLAEEICMLDHLSGGRVEVGIGRGASPHELDYFGVDSDQAQAMYVEAYQVIMQSLTKDEVNF